MASVDLGGQNEYAYDTTNPNLWGVFEIKFFDIWSGFCVKSVQTDRQTDTFPLYIYRFQATVCSIYRTRAHISIARV